MYKIFHHWALPVVACIIWWGMLIAMLAAWAAQGRPVYYWISRDAFFLYISDIGATNLKPLFISCAGAQGIFFILTLVAERYLRHSGRLLPNWRRREKVFAGLSIFFACIGQLGILMVAIFDNRHYPDVHVAMLLVFLVGIALSAFFTTAEFKLLDKGYVDVHRLRISYSIKILWIVLSIALAIGFGVCSLHHKSNAAAILEWILAFLYGFYLLLLAYDIAPAAKTPKGLLLENRLGMHLNRIASWIPGMRIVLKEPPLNSSEMTETHTLGNLVFQNRLQYETRPSIV